MVRRVMEMSEREERERQERQTHLEDTQKMALLHSQMHEEIK